MKTDLPPPRPLYQIAAEIFHLWRKPSIHAMPYLSALRSLNTPRDPYGHDSGESIILYFLSNSSGWRGPDAQRLKAELKQHLPNRH